MRRPGTTRSRAAQTGFTLLENLVAIVIFSIGLLGVVGLQARSIQFSVDGEDRNRASLMADGIVATMWGNNLPSAGLDATARAALAAGATGGPYNATTAVGAPDANGVVEISITWRPPSRSAAEPDSSYTTKVFIPSPTP
jgi:type IV pilus assembly protein PilV